MDDDDYYPDMSVITRIRVLLSLNKDVCGSSVVNCFDIMTNTEFEAFDPDENGNPMTISESTLAYSKKFFEEQQFNKESKTAECLDFLKNRYERLVRIPSSFIVTQLTHDSNTIQRRISDDGSTKGFLGISGSGSLGNHFFDNLNAIDEAIITDIKAYILVKDPFYKKLLTFLKKDPVKFFREYDDPFNKDPDRIAILKNPLIIDFRANNGISSIKKGPSLGTIAYYCGPGSFFKFDNEWSPDSLTLGGSEESVIKLANKFSEIGYKVIFT